jgi:lysophospholipase L1-like esterase
MRASQSRSLSMGSPRRERALDDSMTSFARFIALGDSMTEGMNDVIINGNFRGWADRVADVLATTHPNFTYMNLAIRGKLVGQVVREQIPVALKNIPYPGSISGGYEIKPSEILVSFHAGANDILRPKYSAEETIATYNKGVEIFAERGVRLMLFCILEDFAAGSKTGSALAERFRYFNENVKRIARNTGAILLDPNPEPFWHDRSFMSWDRLHMNSEGHHRAAQGVLAKLELPHDPKFREPHLRIETKSQMKQLRENIHWFFAFLLPWIWRRIRGRSSGDGRAPKYGEPISWPLQG